MSTRINHEVTPNHPPGQQPLSTSACNWLGDRCADTFTRALSLSGNTQSLWQPSVEALQHAAIERRTGIHPVPYEGAIPSLPLEHCAVQRSEFHSGIIASEQIDTAHEAFTWPGTIPVVQ